MPSGHGLRILIPFHKMIFNFLQCMPSLHPYLLHWSISPERRLPDSHRSVDTQILDTTWRLGASKDFGLFSGTQLMNFSNQAWLPCDNTDMLDPLVPSVTDRDLFILTWLRSICPILHLHSTYSFPWRQARSTLPESVVLVLCLVKELGFPPIRQWYRDVFLALEQWQKGPREQKPIFTRQGNFPLRTCVRSRSCCPAPCPDAAHEDPPVTYVPPIKIHRVIYCSYLQKRQPLKILSLAQPLFSARC